jgi:pantoate--beta-alanine ligase
VKIVRHIAELSLDGAVGLVPTMGALHDGHRALFRTARAENDTVVASLFVNPAQFDEAADLAAYPRDETRDAAIAEEEGVDVLFAPSAEEMYPPGFGTWVDPDDTGAEGAARPGHFRGVATVCLKLMNIVRPERAYFGQKDAQQVAVLRRLVRDLNVPVEIRVVPTVRDNDGLALSSRNVYLSPEDRAAATVLHRALQAGAQNLDTAVETITAIVNDCSQATLDYAEVVVTDHETRLLVAAKFGTTRLLDNLGVPH